MFHSASRTTLVVLVFAVVAPAPAADNVFTRAVSAVWNESTANWTNPTIWNNGNVDSALFRGAGVGIVVTGSPVTARALHFSVSGYSVNGTNLNPLTLASGGGGSLGVGEIRVDTGTAQIGAPILGSVGLTKTGAGNLILFGNNGYTGTTTISAGILSVGNGTSGIISGTVVNNGALRLNRDDNVSMTVNVSGTGSVAINGSGTLTLLNGSFAHTGLTSINDGTLVLAGSFNANAMGNIVNNATLVFDTTASSPLYAGNISGPGAVRQSGSPVTITGTNTYSGGTTIESGNLSIGNNGTTGSIVGNVLNHGTLAFQRSNAMTFDGAISGTGLLRVDMGNVLTFSAAHTYTGNTNINSGTLALTGTASVAASPLILVRPATTLTVTGLTGGLNYDGTRFALASGQTLTGTGTVNGGLSVRNGSTLAAGIGSATYTGTTTVTGDLDIQAGGTLAVRLNGLTAGDIDTNRSRALVSGAFTFAGTAANPFVVRVQNSGAFNVPTAASYTIVDAASIGSAGLDTPLTLIVGAGGTATATNASNIQLFVSAFVPGDQFTLTRNGSDILLQFVPVPEPVFLLGVAVLAVATGARVRQFGIA